VQKELADIIYRLSQEEKKEVDCRQRMNQIHGGISNGTSESTLRSKMNEIHRKQAEIASIAIKKAELNRRLADKNSNLFKLQQDLAKEEERERKKQAADYEKERKRIADLERRQRQEQLEFQRKLRSEIHATTIAAQQTSMAVKTQINLHTNYDLFISHASEDKEEFVRPLAEALQAQGIKVWYDEFTLRVGDSLRKSIDHGLRSSNYGTVILSSSFFAKNWPQYELDAMVAREMDGHKMILPIWHKVTKSEVINFSPSMADKVALNTSFNTIEEIANQLADVIRA
jgi:hypothetical protein